MGLKFRRGSTAQQSGSLAFGEPYVNTTLGTLVVGGATGDIVLSSTGTGSTGNFGAISGSGLDITGNAKIAGNLTLGGAITIGDASADTVNVVASLSSSLIPSVTNAFDLGSETKFWRDLYISTGSIKFVGAAGQVVGTLSNTGNGLSLDGGVVANGNSTFGTSSAAVTSITGSLRVSGSITTIGASTATSFNGAINANNGVVSGSSQLINLGFPTTSSQDTLTNKTLSNPLIGSFSITSDSLSRMGTYGNNVEFFSKDGFLLNPTTDRAVYIDGYDNNNKVVITSDLASYETCGRGIVSGSTQVTPLLPTGTVSGSSQITAGSTTNFATDVKTQLNSNTVVSGSSQVTLSSTTGGSTSSNVQFGSLGIGMAATGTSGRIDAANDIVAFSSSDIRFKENITPIENALDKISKISGNTYDWKAENKAEHGYEGNDVGVIAQEIEAVLPQLVQTRESGFKAVKYDKLVALLIEGIKEQQTQIHSLTIEIEKLKEAKGL